MNKTAKIVFVTVGFLITEAFAGKEIVIDLTEQRGYAIEEGEAKFSGKISSGVKGMETPRGEFVISEKKKDHNSNLWPKPNGGAKMPYMMRLSGSAYALHLGHVPDRPDSHGCVRLENGFAQKAYNWANIGTKVIIKGKFRWREFYAKKGAPEAYYSPKSKRIIADERETYSEAKLRDTDAKIEEENFELLGYYEDDATGVVEFY